MHKTLPVVYFQALLACKSISFIYSSSLAVSMSSEEGELSKLNWSSIASKSLNLIDSSFRVISWEVYLSNACVTARVFNKEKLGKFCSLS